MPLILEDIIADGVVSVPRSVNQTISNSRNTYCNGWNGMEPYPEIRRRPTGQSMKFAVGNPVTTSGKRKRELRGVRLQSRSKLKGMSK